MQIGIVTLFPEMFSAISEYGISSRAVRSGLVKLDYYNPRDFTTDKHRTVDDKPFGGGPGMLMKTEPLLKAVAAAKATVAEQGGGDAKVIYLSPQGRKIDQQAVIELARRDSMVMICGRYQGIDNRMLEREVDEEWSLGDFVISGGEIAAMALIDSIIRFQPGALGDEDSAQQDSFANGLLHSPEYTRPQSFMGQDVPAVLLSGDHEAIRKWRLQQSLGMTWLKRPDLLEAIELDKEQEQLLEEFKRSHSN
ncbi:MAG: tRNA (guanosine(37)-N1)-methyltransferase TrmD [Gammaproteobacteria bacterium]|nr:tRNA (guanosine(37)-N1)-methyltransferase TrmD [Gammaproteobacteria bacterium]MBT3859164.1 tRNA (guanosine(37)-N1)-methyltransferase TrmD [Gammaproteobacteria bacterium]MBT3987164.1 tRNA (guanosine(37)-N1)-methyltransferase TrmD [Gammaproteobacteria bacterium]MBT4255095.1 tRNA (guanosine(37)-N1)-methyltransferase TrmD [Gammaproteobacteria bacterium]MBT4580583.1 tRNA (guanosine(37)-N1)-methyltransferase TrmD [Gammaproteobacteria bacterium]